MIFGFQLHHTYDKTKAQSRPTATITANNNQLKKIKAINFSNTVKLPIGFLFQITLNTKKSKRPTTLSKSRDIKAAKQSVEKTTAAKPETKQNATLLLPESGKTQQSNGLTFFPFPRASIMSKDLVLKIITEANNKASARINVKKSHKQNHRSQYDKQAHYRHQSKQNARKKASTPKWCLSFIRFPKQLFKNKPYYNTKKRK